MGIGPIAQTHHHPRPSRAAGLGPSDATPRRSHHRGVGSQIKAMDPSQAEEACQVLDGSQVLVAGASDPFHPAAPGQGLLGKGSGAIGGDGFGWS
jgi:hypothetical protein